MKRSLLTLRLDRWALSGILALTLLLSITVYFAPEPPDAGDTWRWSTIIVASGLCAWNIRGAYRAYRSSGILSAVGFLHAWSFFAFSFPAAEMTYRYDSIEVGYYWGTNTNEPLLFKTVLVLGLFQALFFLALGREPHGMLNRLTLISRAKRPNFRFALVFFLLAALIIVARLSTILDLGVGSIAATIITREGYWERLSSPEGVIRWFLNSLFPVYAVSLLCLGIKYLVKHPSVAGGWLYAAALVVSSGGVVISGVRSELVYVTLTVIIFMYAQGYRRITQYKSVFLPLIFVGVTVFLVAQARHGAENPLSNLTVGNPVGYDYATGDITQVLGLGRFNALLIIPDNFQNESLLWGKSYAYALVGGLNATFLPKIVLGDWLPTWRISEDVMGYWIFAEHKASALPSAPGELLLNFGVIGVALGALILGFAGRLLFRWILGFAGSVEFAWIITLWTTARFLSDESYLMVTYAAKNWVPVMLLTIVLARQTRNYEPEKAALGSRTPAGGGLRIRSRRGILPIRGGHKR